MSLALFPLTVTLMGLMMTCDTLKLALGGYLVKPTGYVPILKQVSKRQKRSDVYNAKEHTLTQESHLQST